MVKFLVVAPFVMAGIAACSPNPLAVPHPISAVVVSACGNVAFGEVTYSDGSVKKALPPNDLKDFATPDALYTEALKAPKEAQFAVEMQMECEPDKSRTNS